MDQVLKEIRRLFVVCVLLSSVAVVLSGVSLCLIVNWINVDSNVIDTPVATQSANLVPAEKTVRELQNGKPFRGVWNGLEHPVIRTMILGFMEACEKYGADCQVMGIGGFEDSDYIKMVEQSVAQGASGMIVGTYGPFQPSEMVAIKQGIPVVGFHTPMKPEDMPGLLAWVATDVTGYGKDVANAMAHVQ
jgi:ABC-type sugar transport system substrate-binding protein